MITLDTPLTFTARNGSAYSGSKQWLLPDGITPGQWMRDYKSRPVLGQRGHHWCEARHAVHHLDEKCYLVEPRGKIIKGDKENASQGARLLRHVKRWNARTARLFAADCAEAVVHLCGDDPGPREAIETARRYARRLATAADLANAWITGCSAAEATPRTAARSAAYAAAWAAAGGGAARGIASESAACAALAAAQAAWDAQGALLLPWDEQTALLLRYLNGEIT
jgi:hypothetical protein